MAGRVRYSDTSTSAGKAAAVLALVRKLRRRQRLFGGDSVPSAEVEAGGSGATAAGGVVTTRVSRFFTAAPSLSSHQFSLKRGSRVVAS